VPFRFPALISSRMPGMKFAACSAFLFAFQFALAIAAPTASAQDSAFVGVYNDGFDAVPEQIPGPSCLNASKSEGPAGRCTAAEHQEWLADVRRWRSERLIRIGYNGARYDVPETRWTQTSFIPPQMMVEDRYFYDPVAGKYTVDRYLDDLEKRYGGIDSVLIWPTYPNMGIDNRNQHDMIRAMPGGIAGVRQMIAEFHKRGVRVLFPMMMWDQGTRDAGTPWPDAIAELMAEIGADGINGDTQDGVPRAFIEASEKIHHPIVFEPEGGPTDEAVAYNLMTWGQYPIPPFVPRVDRYKWLEPRHMVNVTDRWNRDKTGDLQYAFFNGAGWESWESVLGNLDRHYAARCRSGTTRRDIGTRASAVSDERWMGTVRTDGALRRLRQPLATGRSNGVDDRQSQRIRSRRSAKSNCHSSTACATSISIAVPSFNLRAAEMKSGSLLRSAKKITARFSRQNPRPTRKSTR